MTRQRRTFTAEFKLQLVKLYVNVIKVTDLTKSNSFETFERLKLSPRYLYGSLNRWTL
ncbi:transposase [Salipaludibacillus sp. LMS25]|jgi:hypothetical protein|uniref:transposase n=1 Tax=Salipaludibacillus sp. LMS25 TaxID=2924031 RepID=UPI0020D0B36C|nr:transposase [Salipaludibacillus sp. LMS25]UTR16053.1 transposase [Salipaludibacillus sp. LMS25]